MASYLDSEKQQFYQSMVKTIGLTLKLPVCIWLMDEKGQMLQIAAAEGLPAAYIQNATLHRDEPSVAAEVLRTGQTIVVEDITQEKRWKYRSEAAEMGLKSAMIVPLQTQGKTVGVLDVYTPEVRTFTDLESALIQNFAVQVAATQELINQTTVLTRISVLLGSELKPLTTQDSFEILQRVAESARDVLNADIVHVYRYIQLENRYMLPPVEAGTLQGPRVEKREIFADDVIVQVVEKGEALYFLEAQTEASLSGPFTVQRPARPGQRFVVREGVLSSAAIPLKAGGETVGVMFINYRHKQRFSLEQKNIIELFAAQAAFAIYSAWIYERLQKRIKALQALNKVGTRLNLAEGLPEILNLIVRSGCEVMEADIATVHLFNAKQQEFYELDQAAVFPPEARKDMDKPRGDGLGMQVIQSGRVLCVDVLQEDPRTLSTFVKEQEIQSYVGLPLTSIDEPLGVLYLSFKKQRRFAEEELALFDILASYASTAILQSRLFEQRRVLADIARDISSELDRPTLLQRTLIRSLDLLNCEYGSISVFDPQRGLLKFQYAVGKPTDMGVKLKEGLIGTAAAERSTVLVNDVSKDPRYVEHVGTTRSELDVPMLVGDRLVGVLNAESRRLNAFSSEDKRLAEALAAQAAVAFRTAELYEESQDRVQKRVDDIQALQRIFALIGTGSQEKVLAQIVEEAARLTPAKYTSLWLIDAREQRLKFGAMNQAAQLPSGELPQLLLDDTSINGHVAKMGESYRCDDITRDPYYLPWYADVRSELAVPLKYGERVIGTLNLESPLAGAFTDDHQRLAESLAGAAAAAIHSTRVFSSLHIVNKVNQALTKGVQLRENEVLELIHQTASQLMDTDNMYIALYDEAKDEVRFGLAYVKGEEVNIKETPGWEPRRGGKGKTEDIIKTREPIFHKTRQEAEDWYAQPGHKEYVGYASPSWIGVPITLDEKVLGVIATYHPDLEYVYTKDDLEALQVMASQAATALYSGRLYARANRLRNFLVEVGQELASDVQLQEATILNLIYEQTKKLTGARDMYVALYNEDTQEISFIIAMEHGAQVETGISGWATRQINTMARGRIDEIIMTGEPILHHTHQESMDWYERPNHAKRIRPTSCSYLGVPMRIGDKTIGVIAIYDWEREFVYDEDDQTVLIAMGKQAAIALQNARLYRAARSEVVASRQLATLGAAMAALQHRISNTLNLINPNLQRLRKRVDVEDEAIAEILDIIDRNVYYTSEIIRRILEPLKTQEVQTVDVNAILTDVVGQVRELRRRDSTQPLFLVTLDLDGTIPLISAPTGQLAEIFRNLIENAFSVMKTGGELSVSSKLTDSQIDIRFKDSGPGIPPHIQQRLFNQPVPSGEPGGGSGLGLWLSQLILRSLGGEIEIESSDATGTIMKVRIPTSEMR